MKDLSVALAGREQFLGGAVIMAANNAQATTSEELRWALILVVSAGIDRMIVEAGPEIETFLADLRQSLQLEGTSRKLMARHSDLMTEWSEEQERSAHQPKCAGALSRREVVVVRLIGQGQSNKEIARQLGIAPETVKTHIKSIFSKLGVERRTHAVLRAHALGLLDRDVQTALLRRPANSPSDVKDSWGAEQADACSGVHPTL
jgi:LuxR family transcriptional regulator, maltose regulon positive regulatory protein